MSQSSNVDLATSNSWIKPYYPAFDGLRAVAILMVFFVHYLSDLNPATSDMWLWTGVDLFFVLSGFLITGILFDSTNHKHYFRDFYIRRSLRILPLAWGFFLLVFLLTPALHLVYSSRIWSNPLYIVNFLMPDAVLHRHGNPTLIYVPHLHGFMLELGAFWTLAVEEQFYILWPLLVWLFPKRRALMRLCVVLVCATVAVRTSLYFHDPAKATLSRYLYWVTYARCDSLLIGAWIALWLRGNTPSRESLRRIAYILFFSGAGIAFILVILFANGDMSPDNKVMNTVGYTLIALAASGVLLRCLDPHSHIHRALLLPWLKRLGVVSYGFYFFHNIPIRMFMVLAKHLEAHHLKYLILPISFVFIYALAELSFRFYESPFLRLKKVFAPGHRGVPPPDPAI